MATKLLQKLSIVGLKAVYFMPLIADTEFKWDKNEKIYFSMGETLLKAEFKEDYVQKICSIIHKVIFAIY